MTLYRSTTMALLTAILAAPAMAEKTTPAPMPMQSGMRGNMPMMQQGMGSSMPMMQGGKGGGMPMMPMMQKKQAMMQAHMKRMETHMANIEALLRELVALQKKRQ